MPSGRVAHLVLEDGTVFPGIGVGAPGVAAGEACFTTAMAGYEEAVTDPSYVAQVLCFAYPLVGTYGVDETAARVRARAVRGSGDARRAARLRRLAARPGRRRSQRRRHADARSPDPIRRRRPLRARRCARRRAPVARARRAADRRAAARPGDRDRESPTPSATGPRVVVDRPRLPSARFRGVWPPPASRRSSSPATGTRTRCSRPRPHAVLVVQRARRSIRARRADRDDPRPARPGARCSGSASATSCSASRSGTRRSSCRSVTAGPTIPFATRRPDACSSPSRTTAIAVAAERRRRARVAERRHLRGPGRRRVRERPVPPGGVTGPARRPPLLRPAGRRHAEAHRPSHDPDPRLRADPDRPGVRVRLLRRAGMPRAPPRGLPRRARQLEPGDDHDRPGVGRRDLPRAARPGHGRAR